MTTTRAQIEAEIRRSIGHRLSEARLQKRVDAAMRRVQSPRTPRWDVSSEVPVDATIAGRTPM